MLRLAAAVAAEAALRVAADVALGGRVAAVEAFSPLATAAIAAEMTRATAAESSLDDRVAAVVAWLGLLTQILRGA